MIISKTPLRVSFAGGGTDLPSFYVANGYGAVLSTCIDSYIYVSIKEHTSLFDERIRLNYSETELVNRVEMIQNAIIRECLRFLEIDDRIYISTIADAPAQSGLGSSSAFCVGLLNALYKYIGVTTSPGRLAEEAAHIEIDVLRRPVGKQDHYAAAFGGLNFFEFRSDGAVTVRPIIVAAQRIAALSDSMISFWTRETRPAEAILAEQDGNTARNTSTLVAMRDQARVLADVLCNGLAVERFGQVVHEGWTLKRQLASKISSDSIDRCYQLAMDLGAYGGKISGAGGGGFLNVFAPTHTHERITKALGGHGFLPYKFHFEARGTAVMRFE
jgi:D-glycero-alpha-D-manno-heptose-7-phosphate kinase